MAKIINNISDHADTVITLKGPPASFAVWDPLKVRNTAKALHLVQKTVDTRSTHTTPDADEQFAAETLSNNTEKSVIENPAGHTIPIVGNTLENTFETNPFERSAAKDKIHYYVSSFHLKSVSPRFTDMLAKGRWMEGVPEKHDDHYHISAEDWDADAFLLFLKAIHLRNGEVPLSLSLEMLAKIAVLIDYYDCAEAFALCIEIWTRNIRETSPVPPVLCRDLMLWMCIARVFRMPNEYTQARAIALKQADRELSTLDLPITSCVEEIDEARLEAIDTLIGCLHDLLEKYGDLSYQCPNGNRSFECGSILYGALSRQMRSAGLPTDPEKTSYHGLRLWETCTKLKDMKSPEWYDGQFHRSQRIRLPDLHPCSLSKKLDELIADVIHTADGFSLGNFGRA